MRIVLESLRFTCVFFVFSTILGIIAYMLYSIIGIDFERYGWTAIIGVFVLTYLFYRNRGWGKVYNKKIVWISIILIMLLSLLIPDVTPEHLHTNKYAYSYGFPFNFITLYIKSGTKYLIPNLLSEGFPEWNIGTGILANFIIFYLTIQLIFKKVANKNI